MKHFKKLKGQRVLLNLPKKDEGKLIVDENTKEALHKEMLEKLNSLEVFAIGDGVIDLKPKDKVLVDPALLSKSPIISINGENKVLINYFDIILIW
jgi:hypothetical protein